MSSLNDRLNDKNVNDIYMGTGRENFPNKKLPVSHTYFVDSIPTDRHKFSHFVAYLNGFSSQINELAFDTCKKDCKRQMDYVHGKNVNASNDLISLCERRCRLHSQNFDMKLGV